MTMGYRTTNARAMMCEVNGELPKSVKRILKDLAVQAHKNALTSALEELARDVDLFRKSEIDCFELAHRVHQFHEGPDRQIHLRYTRSLDLPYLIVQSVREGLIAREEIPEEAMEHLESTFALFRELDSKQT